MFGVLADISVAYCLASFSTPLVGMISRYWYKHTTVSAIRKNRTTPLICILEGVNELLVTMKNEVCARTDLPKKCANIGSVVEIKRKK